MNLAEYADRGEDDEVITRRYLMQDSKVNSTLKVAIIMRHVEGDRNYSTYVYVGSLRDIFQPLIYQNGDTDG